MATLDHLGHPLTGANADSRDHYETALHQMRCYVGDPVATIDRAIAVTPQFVMAHALRAYLHLLGTEPLAIPTAQESLARAEHLTMNARERGHVEAIRCLIAGRWYAAARILEDVAIDHPRDVVALQAGHIVDFLIGDSRMLRDRVARARPAWSEGMPGYHAVVGMHAFGLEEMGEYVMAEREGRRSVDLERRDAWGWHAVAHVMEMQGRQREGIAWLRSDCAAWSEDSYFCVHNWWHLALYHLDLGETEEVLRLFDGPIHGGRSKLVMDLIDASALLWRLTLLGIDVGTRWQTVADNWQPLAGAGTYAFNDAHAMMALAAAGRTAAVAELLAAQEGATATNIDNAMFTREIGRPVTLAIKAFLDRDYVATVTLLRPVRNRAARFGGSHAQRDLLDLTLLEAALRAGQWRLAAALANERVAVKPSSPLARLFVQRAAAMAATA